MTAGWVQFGQEYQQKVAQLKSGPLSAASVNAKLNSWEEQIKGATIEASLKHSDALTHARWQDALNLLKNNLEHASKN